MQIYKFFKNKFSRIRDILCKSFTRKFRRSEVISIVGIHASLLAVLISGFSVYIIFVFSKVEEREMQALQEASKINEIKFVGSLFGEISSDEISDRKKLIRTLFLNINCRDDAAIPNDPSRRIAQALGIMEALMRQYPYPQTIFKTPEGRLGIRSESEPIIFGDIEEVRKWVNDIDEITYPLMVSFKIGPTCFRSLLSNFNKLKWVIERKYRERNILNEIKNSDGSCRYDNPTYLDPLANFEHFCGNLILSVGIMKKTKYYLNQADKFRSNYPSVFVLILGFLMVQLIMIFGIIIPLLSEKISIFFLLYLPLLFYFSISLGIAFKMLKTAMT